MPSRRSKDTEIRDLLLAVTRVEAKLDAVMQMLRPAQAGAIGAAQGSSYPGMNAGAELFFRQFTAKQNAALQMILRGAENSEIAARLGVSPNTAKVHVRVIAGKLGVSNRVQIAMKARGPFDAVDDVTYRQVSGGLPKDWDAGYADPDPYGYIYRKEEESFDASEAEQS